MENQDVVDRIIDGALQGDNSLKSEISLMNFFKCISKLTTKDFNEKIDLFFKVIIFIV
jgi:hypothetical protein